MDYAQLFLNNGVGVFFGVLFYRMANTTLKENTAAINQLKEAILKKF